LRFGNVPYKWIVAMIFVIGLFMDIMDTTIVNVALPTLRKEFNATEAAVEWVVIGYLLSLAVWIPASGWIGDRIGTKRTFLFALGAFTIASALCGQAHSLGELIGFRILQGVGGGMLTPVGTAMLFRAFPPAERAKASTVLVIPTVLAPAIGPVIGGWLVTDHSWRWIFYVNLPLGVFGFVIGALFLREHREPTAGAFDLAGFVLSGGGLALVLYALSEGPELGWRSPAVLGTGILGIVLFAALVKVELRLPSPMLTLRLYRDRMFRNANMVLTFSFASFAAMLFLLPQFLQGPRGLTAFQSGLTTFPQALGVMLSSQVAGRLYHYVGPRRLIFGGMIGVAIVSLTYLGFDQNTSLWWIRAVMFARGLCMAFGFVPLQAATYANISSADTGRASAIYTTQRQVAAALGVAALATVWISRTNALSSSRTPTAAVIGGFHDAFVVGAVLAVFAAIAALFIRDSDAANTMVPRRVTMSGEEPTPDASVIPAH
jgi:EmrB/QacA subfamily drug resistance transporter